MDQSVRAAQQFAQDVILSVHEYGGGNVNDTFLVTQKTARPFVLQRINTRVFVRPELIMLNLRTFSRHVQQRLQHDPSTHRWESPQVIQTHTGQDYWIDEQGGFWRALSFVEGARTFEQVQSLAHAGEAGYALGRFQNLISDLDPTQLYDTLEGFHVTPRYVRHYQAIRAQLNGETNSPKVRYGCRFVQERQDWAGVLETARQQGQLLLRPIHGDPKINNMMIDETTGQAISLVDLDTVKPGLVHYDVGDCLRSCCNPLGEETTDLDAVRFETDLARAILQGYLDQAGSFLTANDYAYLYDCIRLIAFELGLRFFTDHLAGNVYFKVRHPEHNLQRALVQFKLTESIERQERDIRQIIREAAAQTAAG